MRTERTTELGKLKTGAPFTWGHLVDIYTVGREYHIVEFKPWIYENHGRTDRLSPESNFHIYMNGKDLSNSYGSFDEALIGLVVIKHAGFNDHSNQVLVNHLKMQKSSTGGYL